MISICSPVSLPPGLPGMFEIAGDDGFPSLVDLNLLVNDPHDLLPACSEALERKGCILERRERPGDGVVEAICLHTGGLKLRRVPPQASN